MDDTLKDIRLAETEAKRLVEEARKKGDLDINKEKEKSLASIKASEEEIKKQIRIRYEQEEKKLKAKKEEILEDSKDKMGNVEKVAKKNMKEAIALIITKFEDEIK